jgi:hypothetical protein
MANLYSVQEQLRVIKSGTEIEKKKSLTPESIADVRKFIADERAGRANGTNYSLEGEFKEWEDLVSKFDIAKNQIATNTANATASVSADPLGSLVSRRDIEESIRTELQKELKWLDGKLETMSPEELEWILTTTSTILDLAWISKIPAMKERAAEIIQYRPLIEGITGAMLLKKLQKLGYALHFTAPNQIKIVSPQSNARDVEVKLNAHLAKSPTLSQSLQWGLLYGSTSFHSYRNSVTNADGSIINPSKVDIKSYTEYLRKKPPNTLDQSEKSFLLSQRSYDPRFNFQASLLQSKEYAKVVGMISKLTWDTTLQSRISQSVVIPSQANGSAPGAPSSDDSVAAKIWWGIGSAAEIVWKIAKTGVGGWLDFLGTAMAKAWPMWSVAIIGAILWSIFSEKWLGFMGTLGAIFGVWLLSNAGDLRWIIGNWNGSWTPPAKPTTPWTGTETLAPVQWAAAWVSSAPDKLPETQPRKPSTINTVVAQAMGKENPHEASVDAEMKLIQSIDSVNFTILSDALKKNDAPSWNAFKKSIGYDTMSSASRKEIDSTILDPKNTAWRETLLKLVDHISKSEHVIKLKVEDRQKKTLKQMMDYVVAQENQEQSIEAPESNPAIIHQLNLINQEYAGYGDIVVLARMVEYGYLPKINYTVAEIKASKWFFATNGKSIAYIALGGPLTNNAPGANWFSWKNQAQEKKFVEWLDKLVTVEKAELDAKATTLSPQDPDFAKTKLELEARRNALYTLTEKIAWKDPAQIKQALQEYRKAAKTPWHVDRMKKPETIRDQEAKKIAELEKINTRIEEEYKIMKDAQEIGNKEDATPEQKKAAQAAAEKYNKSVVDLEANGMKSLSQVSQEARTQLEKTNPWVARVAAANGWMAKFNEKLNGYTNKWISKWIMWVWIVGLIWNHQWSLAELWKKGDYTQLGKLGWDFVAGAVPILSSVHETAILSNSLGYKDFILWEWYTMGNIEKWFRVVWAIPLGGVVTKTVWKWAIAVGEKMGANAIKASWQAIAWVSDIAMATARATWQVGTYSILGYSAFMMTYDLWSHLSGNEVRKESVLSK